MSRAASGCGRVCAATLLLVFFACSASLGALASPRRIAFLVESWYPRSHADVIGIRFLEGYRVGGQRFASPVTVASVFTETPQPNDMTRSLASRYGFRVAGTVAEALLEDPRAARPRLGVDGILIATREDPQDTGQTPSPTPRLRLWREVMRVFEQTGTRVPIFIDKMIAANWSDAQAIVTDAATRGIPLMAGSVLGYMPFDRAVLPGKVDVGVAIGAGPYWAYAFHTAEVLQRLMELRTARETGISSIREVGTAYWAMPDRDRWGARVVDALLAGTSPARPGTRARIHVLLIQYVDGARAVLALMPRAFDEAEFRVGTQFADGALATGGVMLRGEPFDHFGYLVHALVEFYMTGRAPVPVERTLLTTGMVLLGLEAGLRAETVASRSLGVSYATVKGP